MNMRLLLAAAVVLALGSCKVYDSLYCDAERPCTDPARPFCDLNGEYPESDGIKKTCIADPFLDADAGNDPDRPDGAPHDDGGGQPDAAGGPRAIVQLATAYTQSCAVFNDGGLRCWGTGFLGYGVLQTIGDNELPRDAGDVPAGGPVKEIALGEEFACALYEAGNVRCWGRNTSGKLGYPGEGDLGGEGETPDTLEDVQLGGAAKQIVAAAGHACALMVNGDVRCWGNNDSGELGYGNTERIGDNETPGSVNPVDIGERVEQITAGTDHSCALLESGRVRCWGPAFFGRLGYGNLEDIGDNESPSDAGDVNIGGTVTQVVAGSGHTCALLLGGAVRCWGGNDFGELGYANTDRIGDNEAPATAGNVLVGGAVVELSAGTQHTCARLEDGRIRCWGSGSRGKLGYGDVEDVGDNEDPAAAGNVALGGAATVLSQGEANRAQTCALLETGKVRCWGRNAAAELGLGHTEDIGDNEDPMSAGDVQILDRE